MAEVPTSSDLTLPNEKDTNTVQMTNNLPKTYDPKGTESRWQSAWEKNDLFHPSPNSPGEPFCVVIPPPNVTGS